MVFKKPAPVASDDGDVLQQDSIGCNLRNAPACKTYHEKTAFRSNTFSRVIEYIAANRIVYNIGPASACNLFDLFHPSFIGIIERVLGPFGEAKFELLTA